MFNIKNVTSPDLIFCVVPFTSSILLAYLLKIRHGSKLWIHIQDFEFDAAMEVGVLKKRKWILKPLILLEKRLLKSGIAVSTISQQMVQKLKAKNVENPIFFPNWADMSDYEIFKETNHPHINPEKFSILYSGNFGAKQDWLKLSQIVQMLQPYSDIEIVLVGTGSEKERVEKLFSNFNNTFIRSLVPRIELPLLLASADLHILFQKNTVIDTVLPSKLLGMMASAQPSIVVGNLKSEVKTILEESNGGFYFSGNHLESIAAEILNLKNNKQFAREIGSNAKTYVSKHFRKEMVLERFYKKMKNSLD